MECVGGGEGDGSVGSVVPAIGEALRSAERVFVHLAARGGTEMLVCALEGEIAVAEMSLLGAVAVGEGDADGLSVHRSEIDTHRVPVTPEYIANLMLPA